VNEPNHLSRLVLELTEDRNGSTGREYWTWNRRRVARLTFLVKVMEMRLSRNLILTLVREIGVPSYGSPAL